MRRHAVLALVLALTCPTTIEAQSTHPATTHYRAPIRGQIVGYRLAGIEPDGDPLYQTVLKVRLDASAPFPAMNLIVSSYLENFKPDTTPILPDLLYRNRTARRLGSFLQGKALLTDDAGNVLYIGSFLAEGFLNNSNHAVMRLSGSGAAFGSRGALKGIFTFGPMLDGAFRGRLQGTLTLPAAARAQITHERGAKMRPVKEIIKVVTVRPHAMMGRSTSGSSAPLKTAFSGAKRSPAPSKTPTRRRLSPLSIAAGIGAIASLILAIVLFVTGRRREVRAPGPPPG